MAARWHGRLMEKVDCIPRSQLGSGMEALLRKLRGVLGIGLTWGTLWAAIGAALGLVMRVTVPGSVAPGETNSSRPRSLESLVSFPAPASAFCCPSPRAEEDPRPLAGPGRDVGDSGIRGAPSSDRYGGQTGVHVLPLGALFATASVAIARKAELRDSEPPRLLNSEPRSM